MLQQIISATLSGTVGEMQKASQCIFGVVKTNIGRPIIHALSRQNTIDSSYSSAGTNRGNCGPSVRAVQNIHILSVVNVL